MALLVNHASMTGFVMSDYLDRYNEAVRELAGWLTSGELISREDIAVGLENFPDTLLRLFRGQNLGKLMLEVAPA
jgi:NADPH-dependent curcumin reductase